MSNIGIALQLYTLRIEAARDLPGTLARVREAGFEYVEWSGMPVMPARDIRAALDAAGLKAIGGHCTAESLATDFESAVEHWLNLGVPDVAIAAPPVGALENLQAWREWADRAGDWARAMDSAGIRLACHHRAEEARPFPGESQSRLDLLLQWTAETPLCVQFDTAWLALGGADPAEAIRPYPDRCPLLQVKDIVAGATEDAPAFVPLGSGSLDWSAVFDAGEEIGVEWYVYGQDTSGENIFDALRRSYHFLFDQA